MPEQSNDEGEHSTVVYDADGNMPEGVGDDDEFVSVSDPDDNDDDD